MSDQYSTPGLIYLAVLKRMLAVASLLGGKSVRQKAGCLKPWGEASIGKRAPSFKHYERIQLLALGLR
jgi:hypothetical protein